MKNPVLKTKHSLLSFEAASLPKPQLKHIKGGNGGGQNPPPEEEPGERIGSDDVIDG